MSLFQPPSTYTRAPSGAVPVWEPPSFGYQELPYGTPADAGPAAPYGAEHFPPARPAPPPRRRLPARPGEILIAVGGLVFFVAAFLTWVSFSLGPLFDVVTTCADIPDPNDRASCEAAQAAADGTSTNGWDLVLVSVAGIVMFLMAALAVAVVTKLTPAKRATRKCVAAGLVVVDGIVLLFFAAFDYNSLLTTLSNNAVADAGFRGAGPMPDNLGPAYSLGIGFWLAVAGLLVAHVGFALARRKVRAADRLAR